MITSSPPYKNIGNPKMKLNPFITSEVYAQLNAEYQIIAEIFDLSDIKPDGFHVICIPGPWFWLPV